MNTCPPHRILLASPNGPTVEGKCACGYSRLYSSSGDDDGSLWASSMQAKRIKAGHTVSRQARQFAGGTRTK